MPSSPSLTSADPQIVGFPHESDRRAFIPRDMASVGTFTFSFIKRISEVNCNRCLVSRSEFLS